MRACVYVVMCIICERLSLYLHQHKQHLPPARIWYIGEGSIHRDLDQEFRDARSPCPCMTGGLTD